MPLKHLLLVLKSRIWLILFVGLATVAAGVVFTLSQPKQYVATATLLLNFDADNPLEDSRLPPQLADSYMATQVDIIMSRNVMNRVIDQLDLAETPEERETWVSWMRNSVEVETARQSRVVSIHYQANDPEQAARLANAFAGAYQEVTQNLKVEPAKQNTELFDNQIAQMRERLGRAQSKLTRFQQEKGIVALDERLDSEMTRLNELTNQLVDAQAATLDVRARQLGVNHPEYLQAVERERALREALEEQKQQVLQLKQQRDELEVLARELNVEQDAYSTALQSYYDEQLMSSFAQTSVNLLDPAVPPVEPSSPKVTLNVIGSVLLGGVLAALLALAAELMFRKIRTPEDVGELLDTRVLSSV